MLGRTDTLCVYVCVLCAFVPAPAELKSTAVANSAQGSNKPGNALLYTSGGYWLSEQSRTDSHWVVNLHGDTKTEEGADAAQSPVVKVSSVQLEWVTAKKAYPEWFEIQVSSDGDEYTTVKRVRGEAAKNVTSRNLFWVHQDASHIRIKMHGYHMDNKDKHHGLQAVYVRCVWVSPRGLPCWWCWALHSRAFTCLPRSQINTIPTAGLHSSSASNLATLRSWLTSCAMAPGTPDAVVAAAISSLQGLSLASASLMTILNLTSALLRLPQPSLPSSVAASAFTEQLIGHLTKVHEEASLREMVESGSGGSSGGSGGGGGGGGLCVLNTTFDPSACPSGCTLSNGNMTVRCNSGSGVVVCNNAPFTKGKGAWEFLLDEDSNGGQCSCFGAAMCRPVTSQSYNSNQCWMYRSYNGYKYQQGTTVGSAGAKVKKGDTVRCEVDMDAGTMR